MHGTTITLRHSQHSPFDLVHQPTHTITSLAVGFSSLAFNGRIFYDSVFCNVDVCTTNFCFDFG